MTTHRCLVLDFDGTIVNSLAGVMRAYELAIQEVLGNEALRQYRAEGGLLNRAPREVVTQLVSAKDNEREITALSEQLVECKVDLLLKAIGTPLVNATPWPQLMSGFKSFWRQAGDLGLPRFVLSSGHQDFILKCFELHELEPPLAMLTDDILRKLPNPLCKPDPKLWTELTRLSGWSGIRLEHALYFGDDPKNDGELVRRVPGVDFLLFDPTGKHSHLESFTDWSELKLPEPGWKTW